MEVIFKEKTDKKALIELRGEDHTFCNLLVKELQKDSNVNTAVYRMDHPLTRVPTILVETNGKSTPEKALKDAVSSLKKTTEKFKADFAKAV